MEYGQLSAIFYELSKPIGHSIEGDIEYYTKQLEGVSGLVLEAGVGTGRVLIPLIKKGFKIHGVDSSADMLEQCRDNLKKHEVEAVLYEQDLMNLSLPNKYDAIIMPTGSFCILPRDRVEEVLETFYNHLNKGGKIIIDLEMPSSFQEGTTNISKINVSDERLIRLTSYSDKIDWLLQKTTYTNRYELIEKDRPVKTEISDFILYWYGIEEFKMYLSRVGYKEISYQIGYENKESEIITYIAYK
jgi:SAM-dependent methyltransferase